MATRLYITRARIVNGGADGNVVVCDAVAAAPAGSNTNQYVAIRADGTLALPWGLVAITTANHLPIIADPNTRALPDVTFDARANTMQAGAESAMRAGFQRFGISTAAIDDAMSTGKGYRAIVRTLGQLLEPTFNENNLV